MYRIVIFMLISCVFGLPSPDNPDTTAETVARVIGKDCSSGIFNPTCVKIGALSLIEKLSNKEEVALLPGISLIKDGNSEKAEAVAAELARSLPSKPEERLDKLLVYRLGNFLDTHSVKLRLMDEGAAEEANNMIGEARGKGGGALGGGKKGGMGGLLAMAMMMKGKNNNIPY